MDAPPNSAPPPLSATPSRLCDRTLTRLQRIVNSTQRNYRDALHELERLQALDLDPLIPTPIPTRTPSEPDPIPPAPDPPSSQPRNPLKPSPLTPSEPVRFVIFRSAPLPPKRPSPTRSPSTSPGMPLSPPRSSEIHRRPFCFPPNESPGPVDSCKSHPFTASWQSTCPHSDRTTQFLLRDVTSLPFTERDAPRCTGPP